MLPTHLSQYRLCVAVLIVCAHPRKVWRIAVASDGVEAGGGTIGSRLTRYGALTAVGKE